MLLAASYPETQWAFSHKVIRLAFARFLLLTNAHSGFVGGVGGQTENASNHLEEFIHKIVHDDDYWN